MLKLSTKGRYAVRIMIFLATRDNDIPCRKQEIAESEGISADYVEQILIRLRAGGLVASHRGARGGFTLSVDATQTSVLDVLEATEGALQIAPCDDAFCERETYCVAQAVWKEASAALKNVFSKALIADLARQVREMKDEAQIIYQI